VPCCLHQAAPVLRRDMRQEAPVRDNGLQQLGCRAESVEEIRVGCEHDAKFNYASVRNA
jgi:hypothetical protein